MVDPFPTTYTYQYPNTVSDPNVVTVQSNGHSDKPEPESGTYTKVWRGKNYTMKAGGKFTDSKLCKPGCPGNCGCGCGNHLLTQKQMDDPKTWETRTQEMLKEKYGEVIPQKKVEVVPKRVYKTEDGRFQKAVAGFIDPFEPSKDGRPILYILQGVGWNKELDEDQEVKDYLKKVFARVITVRMENDDEVERELGEEILKRYNAKYIPPITFVDSLGGTVWGYSQEKIYEIFTPVEKAVPRSEAPKPNTSLFDDPQ
jgi:hypothetical protein